MELNLVLACFISAVLGIFGLIGGIAFVVDDSTYACKWRKAGWALIAVGAFFLVPVLARLWCFVVLT